MQAMGRSGHPCLSAVFIFQNSREVRGGDLTGSDIDERSYDVADHLVEEVVASDCEEQPLISKRLDIDPREGTDTACSGEGELIAKTGKVMLSDQLFCGLSHLLKCKR